MSAVRYFFDDELRQRISDGILGWTTVLVLPLAQFAVLFLVFVEVFKARAVGGFGGDYLVFLVLGFWPWLAFSDTALRLSGVLVEKVPLAKKVYFPTPSLLCGVALATFSIHFAGFVLVLFILFLMGRINLSEISIVIPFVWICLFLLSLAIGSVFGVISVFVRDLPRFLGIMMSLLFFLTPVFYPLSGLPNKLQEIMELSPLVAIIGLNRAAFGVGGAIPYDFFVAGCGVSLSVAVAASVYWRLRRDIVDFF